MQILTTWSEDLIKLHWLLVVHLVHLLRDVMLEYLVSNKSCRIIMSSAGVILWGRDNHTIINGCKIAHYLVLALLVLTLGSVGVSHDVFHALWYLVKLSRIRPFIWLCFRSCLPWFLAWSLLWAFASGNSRFASWIFWVLRIPWLASVWLTDWANRIGWLPWVGPQVILLTSLLCNIVNVLSPFVYSGP